MPSASSRGGLRSQHGSSKMPHQQPVESPQTTANWWGSGRRSSMQRPTEEAAHWATTSGVAGCAGEVLAEVRPLFLHLPVTED